MFRKIVTFFISLQLVCTPSFSQNNDFMEGLVGGVIGGALIQGLQNQNKSSGKSRSSISPAERAENKQIQENLNYFGFEAGKPDGILGKGSRKAIRRYQVCLNRPTTGKLDTFEKQFLEQSAFKAQANGMETLRAVSKLSNGYCGLLQKYMIEMLEEDNSNSNSNDLVKSPEPTTKNNETVGNNSSNNNQQIKISNTTNQTNIIVINPDIQKEFDLISNQIKLMEQIRSHIKAKAMSPSDKIKLQAVDDRLALLQNSVRSIKTKTKSEYGVPIKPTNANLGVTAAKASEVFPRVPYYIPGTAEQGELWIKPYVSDKGELLYDFNFVQKSSEFEKIREKIVMAEENLSNLSVGMVKINKWSEKAIEKGVRRNYQKTAYCFPSSMCDEKKVGNSSTEIVFKIYENGSTASSIRRNKGKFEQEYNLSVESGLLLAAYSDYMVEIGSNEFNTQTMSDTDLDSMFED